MKSYVTISGSDGKFVSPGEEAAVKRGSAFWGDADVRSDVADEGFAACNAAGDGARCGDADADVEADAGAEVDVEANPEAEEQTSFGSEFLTPDEQRKAKGVAQMAAGAAVAAVGVPMLILPGPGLAAIAGGVALASRGQRNYSGREATAVEEKLDETAEKMTDAAKEQAEAAAHKIATEAPAVAEEVARKAGAVAGEVANAVSEVVPAAMNSLEKSSPATADAVRKTGQAFKATARKAAIGGIAVLDKAPEIMRDLTRGLEPIISSGKAGFESEKSRRS